MSYYSEQDPLLPKDKPSPEIHGSRPQSINNVYVTEAGAPVEVIEKDDDGEPPRFTRNELPTIMFGLCFFLFISLVVFPYLDDVLGDGRPKPKTIDERVNRILMDTPLIGTNTA